MTPPTTCDFQIGFDGLNLSCFPTIRHRQSSNLLGWVMTQPYRCISLDIDIDGVLRVGLDPFLSGLDLLAH